MSEGHTQRLETALAGRQVRDTGVDMPGPLWDVSADGRILVHRIGDGADGEVAPPRLVVVANWLRVLEERLGAREGR